MRRDVSNTRTIVSNTQNIVSDTHGVVSDTRNVVSDTHNVVSDTHNIVSDIYRVMVNRQETSDGGNLPVSNHHPPSVTEIYRCLDSDKVCDPNN